MSSWEKKKVTMVVIFERVDLCIFVNFVLLKNIWKNTHTLCLWFFVQIFWLCKVGCWSIYNWGKRKNWISKGRGRKRGKKLAYTIFFTTNSTIVELLSYYYSHKNQLLTSFYCLIFTTHNLNGCEKNYDSRLIEKKMIYMERENLKKKWYLNEMEKE